MINPCCFLICSYNMVQNKILRPLNSLLLYKALHWLVVLLFGWLVCGSVTDCLEHATYGNRPCYQLIADFEQWPQQETKSCRMGRSSVYFLFLTSSLLFSFLFFSFLSFFFFPSLLFPLFFFPFLLFCFISFFCYWMRFCVHRCVCLFMGVCHQLR